MPLILIAEDESSILHTIDLKLKKAGYETIACEDGLAAAEQLKTHTPDLIITDILMPLMSGHELISAIRLQEHLKNTPIMVLSTLGQEESVQQAFDLGADEYLKKPFSLAELLIRINKLLQLSKK